MEAVRDAIRGSRSFLSDASFDPWAGLLSGDRDAFVKQYVDEFTSFLAGIHISICMVLRGIVVEWPLVSCLNLRPV